MMTSTGVTLVQVLRHGERPGRNESRGLQHTVVGLIGVVRVGLPPGPGSSSSHSLLCASEKLCAGGGARLYSSVHLCTSF